MITTKQLQELLIEIASPVAARYNTSLSFRMNTDDIYLGFNITPIKWASVHATIDERNNLTLTFSLDSDGNVAKDRVIVHLPQYELSEFREMLERRLDFFDDEILRPNAQPIG